MSPCIGTIEGRERSDRGVWERAAVIVDVYNPSDEDSPVESPWADPVSGDGLPQPRLSKPRRVIGMPDGEHNLYPRISWIEREHNFYYPKKPDNELFTNASRVFKATGNRRHVLGVYVKRMKVRLCFYDRAGTIYTTPLDLRDDAPRIIAALISLSFLDAFSLGLEPYLAAKTNVPPSRLLQGGENYVIDVDGVTFRTNSLIHAGELSARGTAIFEAVPAPPENPTTAKSTLIDAPPRVVVKMSWHMPEAHYEDQLLRLAAERGVAGVARLYCSAVGPRVSEGFRSRLVPDVMYANRELRIQVIGPLARPLYEISDLKTFKAAFKSLVESAFRFICGQFHYTSKYIYPVHHDLFEKTGVLHRDISPGNLMVDASRPTQGVLIDLDFAARVDARGNPLEGETFPHAGTLQFRAFELVTLEKPPKAYYRHDLESFFYTLLWIQGHYLGGKRIDSPEATRYDFDFNRSWESTQSSKRGFLLCFNRPGSELTATSLRDEWLIPMRRLFGEALRAKAEAVMSYQEGKGGLLDWETFGGRVTHETFTKILER